MSLPNILGISPVLSRHLTLNQKCLPNGGARPKSAGSTRGITEVITIDF